MKKIISCLIIFLQVQQLVAQNVGIGTTTPDPASILHLQSTDKAFFPPSMTTEQMGNIPSPKRGMMVYNNETGQYYLYTQYKKTNLPGVNASRWESITSGPRILAWGYYDTASGIINGSENFSIEWDGYGTTNDPGTNWFKLGLTFSNFNKDSMLLMITAVGNGSWDQCIAIGELVEASIKYASIKFTDISRMIADFPAAARRRRSSFYFTLYDMRKQPF